MLRSSMLRSTVLAASLMGPPAGAIGQEVLSAEGMAGIGVQGCETIAGAERAPVLAAAVDWGLGYMAGRRDAGHRRVADEPLSTTDPADLATGLVLYCREHPRGIVLDALRAYGQRVFAEGPAARPRLPRVRPLPRPGEAPMPAPGLAQGEGRGWAVGARPEVALGGAGASLATLALARRAATEAILAAATGAAPAAEGPAALSLVADPALVGGALDLRAVGGAGAAPEASPRPRPRP